MTCTHSLRSIRLASLLGAVLWLSGTSSTLVAEPAPGPDAEALWKHLQQERYRQNWALWPGKGEKYQGTEPHGALLTTYLNPPGHQGVTQKPGRMPAGTVIVKENYTPEGKLDAITTMQKVQGYDPQRGDWHYVKFDPRGKVEEQGKVKGCIECHSKVSGNDYIYTGPVR